MEVMGISVLTIALAVLAGIYLGLKFIAPRTKVEWDDSIIDVVEGAADVLGVDPEELAKRSLGKLKAKVVKK